MCFRYRPPGVTDEEADRLNTALGSAVLDDGRVHLGTTRHRGRVAFRPALVTWRTTASDVAQLPACCGSWPGNSTICRLRRQATATASRTIAPLRRGPTEH
ncbi:hypothetical protein [Micromonospora matsumotoense]|uniref:hypothetical protein n=1 Tax=Micromonospora matsumotoense TaxID=121616 RepID=UPI000B813488|nr:hypothetical protein [Micromonospora matsumotoense]